MNRKHQRMNWFGKFAVAFSGIHKGIYRQNSFLVHLPVALAVMLVASWLKLDQVRWVLLLLSISSVIACELFNSSIEKLAAAITDEYNENVRDALDIASGAVLVAAVFSGVIGVLILAPPFWQLFAS